MTDGQSIEMSESADTKERTLEYKGRTIVRPPTDEERGVTMP